MKFKYSLIIIFCIFLFGKLSAENSVTSAVFANGADLSWITQMEASGKKFYNSVGTQMEIMALIKSLGVNSIRLRVWVNPSDGWCNAADLLAKAKRANDLGLRLMIDFHYSDSWADPSKQTKPTAWSSLSLNDLKTALATHTTDVLNSLKNNGITPEWVQVGNETGNGMLWDTGKASLYMANYAALTTAGYDAVKSVFPDCKVVVHLQNGFKNADFRWIFDGLKNNGAKWDVIALSVYPSWYTTVNDWQNCNIACLSNMNDMVTRYGKDVMVAECGMSWDSPVVCKNFLTDLISKTKSVKDANGTVRGLGVFYWEPESYGGWQGYTLGAFDYSGKPTVAMDAFNNLSQTEVIPENKVTYKFNTTDKNLILNSTVKSIQVYNLNGIKLAEVINSDRIQLSNFVKGIYIVNVETAEVDPVKHIRLLVL